MADTRYYVCLNAHTLTTEDIHEPPQCDRCETDLMWGPMSYTEANWCKRARLDRLKMIEFHHLAGDLRNSLGIILNAVNEMRDTMQQAGYTWPIEGLSDAEIVLQKAHQQLRLW